MSNLYNYVLNLADNTMILGQRLSEWCGLGPFLEEDLAVTNTCLDLIGQAQMFYNLAVELTDSGKSADDLAFLRDAIGYRNVLLVEQPNGDYAQTIVKQYFMDVYHVHLYTGLMQSSNKDLAAVAEKSLKEANYHLERSNLWMLRLANGTEESFNRMQTAINTLWHYHHELFEKPDYIDELISKKNVPDPEVLEQAWEDQVAVLIKSTDLVIPEAGWNATGGLEGHHSKYLGKMLCEMQFLQRAYPNCEW